MIQGTLIILSSLIMLGVAAWLITQRQKRNGTIPTPTQQPTPQRDPECCGMHITCERDSLLAAVSKEIVYYDDEELDTYRGHAPEGYTSAQIEEFRDVLLTLQEDDVPGWLRSLQLREIALPEELLADALLIVGEHRIQHKHDID